MNKELVLTFFDKISLKIQLRTIIIGIILYGCIVLSILIGLKMGSADTNWIDVWNFILGNIYASDAANIIYEFRFPRLIGSVCSGGLMAFSGYMLQVVSRNNLADPGILGMTSGATLGLLISFSLFPTLSTMELLPIVFFSIIITGTLILLLGYRYIQTPFIILIGIAASTILGAITEVIMSGFDMVKYSIIISFLKGSFEGITHIQSLFLSIWFLVIFFLFISISRWLDPLSLGYESSLFLGLNVKYFYSILILLSVLAMSPVIAFAGSISFIGLVSTFLTKHLIGYRGIELGFISIPIGSLMAIWADTFGRTLFAPTMIHAGVFISLIGILLFILITKFFHKNNH